MNLSSDCFVKIFFLIQYFDSFCKDSKKTGFLLSVYGNVWLVYRTGVNIITYGKLAGVPLNIFSSVYTGKEVF